MKKAPKPLPIPKDIKAGRPKYRRHVSGRALIELGGTDFYLGQHGTLESFERYRRKLGEWLTNGRRLPVAPEELTVAELVLAFLKHADSHYVGVDGKKTSEPASIRAAVKDLLRLYSKAKVSEITALALESIQAAMVARGLARKTVNKNVDRIRRMIKWAAKRQMVASSVYAAVQCVELLPRGAAKELPPVEPVDPAVVEKSLPHLSPMLADMVRLQQESGMPRVARCAPLAGARPSVVRSQHAARGRSTALAERVSQGTART